MSARVAALIKSITELLEVELLTPYFWHHSDSLAPTDQLAKKERLQTGSENLVDDLVSEEDFPTLAEWLDDREVLYKERARSVRLTV